MQLLNLQTSATMSSREIAELTGKELSNVHRDIRNMLNDLKKDDSDLNHPTETKDARGYTVSFHLDRDFTDCLLTSYSAVARMRVIKRWRALEAQKAPVHKVPQTLSEALMLGAELAKQVETLALENSQKTEVIEKQAHRLDEAKKWASVKRMETSYGLTFKFSELKKYSLKHGYDMPKVRDANYAAGVNTYHEDVWMAVYQVDIPE